MFCSKCGSAISSGLKYCKTCGNKLTGDTEDNDGMPGKMLDNILTTLVFIVIFGMGILVGLAAVLLANDVKTEVVMSVVITYLATIFGICFSLVRQVPKLIDARLKASGYSADTAVQPLLNPRATAQLQEYVTPVSSVTDHTTRTLEKVPLWKTDKT